MAVFKVKKTKNYTVMSNYHLKDKNLSLKAKGLLSEMLSLPDNWDFSIKGLVAINKESETSIKTTLNELKQYGYMQINKERLPNGRFAYVYNIYEISQLKKSEKPEVENPPMESPEVESISQLNTNTLSTKKSIIYNNKKEIIKEKKTNVKFYGENKKAFFTDEQYEKLKQTFPYDYQDRIQKLDDYMASTGKPYKDCLATLRNWARKEGYKFPEILKENQRKFTWDEKDLKDPNDYNRLLRKEVTIQELIEQGRLTPHYL